MSADIKILIKGNVKKVPFSFYSMWVASKIGITATIDHFNDDTILIEANGENNKIHEFVEWCKVGPYSSEIHDLRIKINGKMEKN